MYAGGGGRGGLLRDKAASCSARELLSSAGGAVGPEAAVGRGPQTDPGTHWKLDKKKLDN